APAVGQWSRSRARDRADELACRTGRGRSGPRVDVYQRDRHEAGRIKKFRTVWLSREVGSTDTARAELRAADVGGFRTPKPEALLRRIVELATVPGDLVVDLFAGAGTSAAGDRRSCERPPSFSKYCSCTYWLPEIESPDVHQ